MDAVRKTSNSVNVQVDVNNLMRYYDYTVFEPRKRVGKSHTFTVELDYRGLRRGTRGTGDLLDLQLQDAQVHSNGDGFLVHDHDGLYFWGTQLYSPNQISPNYDVPDPQLQGAQIHSNEAGENAYSGGVLFGLSDNALSHSKPVTKSQVQSSTDGDTSFGVGGKIFSNGFGTVLLSEYDGSIDYISVNQCFQGYTGEKNCHSAPSDSGYINIYSTSTAFAGLKADGSITTWGLRHLAHFDYPWFKVNRHFNLLPPTYRKGNCGESGGPKDKGYISIKSTECSFTAIKADGTMTTWGTLEGMDTDLVPKRLE
jgi:hypothetical protein